jgi:hypothetical protein
MIKVLSWDWEQSRVSEKKSYFSLMNDIETTRYPFIYSRKKREGKLSMSRCLVTNSLRRDLFLAPFCDILFYMLINCHHEIFTNQFLSHGTNDFVMITISKRTTERLNEKYIFLCLFITSSLKTVLFFLLSPHSLTSIFYFVPTIQEFKWGNNFNILNSTKYHSTISFRLFSEISRLILESFCRTFSGVSISVSLALKSSSSDISGS